MTANPTGRDTPPRLVFARPTCPICDYHVAGPPTLFYCYRCGISWDRDGNFRSWMEPEAAQCESLTCNPWTQIEYRCFLDVGHTGFHKHPAQASWRGEDAELRDGAVWP